MYVSEIHVNIEIFVMYFLPVLSIQISKVLQLFLMVSNIASIANIIKYADW